jgi:hypothetical protein
MQRTACNIRLHRELSFEIFSSLISRSLQDFMHGSCQLRRKWLDGQWVSLGLERRMVLPKSNDVDMCGV